jgi:hypothetical protein
MGAGIWIGANDEGASFLLRNWEWEACGTAQRGAVLSSCVSAGGVSLQLQVEFAPVRQPVGPFVTI